MRVVATAGHVDHGKSTLVLALTGTDPDRFPEEKARGLTIDLGFAFTTLSSGRDVGFVDVPGHTRFIKNMLAGVGAVDVAMLIVAANEGWKPQSEEHLRILDLLAVQHGIVVITKADLVDDETLAIAALEVEEHVEGTSFAGLEIVTCDARSGRGLDDVRAALDRALATAPDPRDLDRPRLWIDRVFAAKGAGTVVTGTLTGGSITVDDELDAGGHRVRVRAVESHGVAAPGEPGARVALNLVGVDRQDLTRGDAVTRPGQWLFVTIVDVALTVIPGVDLRRRARLLAAVGSGEHPVWCRRLDDSFARLRFNTALPLAPGDRLVLRDPGSASTVAGAEIRDVTPTRRAADAPARLVQPLGARLLATGWTPVADLGSHAGLTTAAAEREIVAVGGVRIADWYVPEALVTDLRSRIATTAAEYHHAHPSEPGTPIAELAASLGITGDQLRALVTTMMDLGVDRGCIRISDHITRAAETAGGIALLAALRAAAFSPSPPEDLALARALVREGHCVELDGVYYSATAINDARNRIVEALRERGSLTVADIRDLLGSTRKFVLPIVNHMDAQGVTRRRGDDRIPGPRSGLLAG